MGGVKVERIHNEKSAPFRVPRVHVVVSALFGVPWLHAVVSACSVFHFGTRVPSLFPLCSRWKPRVRVEWRRPLESDVVVLLVGSSLPGTRTSMRRVHWQTEAVEG